MNNEVTPKKKKKKLKKVLIILIILFVIGSSSFAFLLYGIITKSFAVKSFDKTI